MNDKINVILLHSESPSTGKTYLANDLVLNSNYKFNKLSFALPIKTIAYSYYTSIFNTIYSGDLSDKVFPLDFSDFCQYKKDINIYDTKITPRDLTVDVSNQIQNMYGDTIWGEILYKNLKSLNSKFIVIDDWRRDIELNVLSSKPDLNILKVYISKEGLYAYDTLSDLSKTFEKQINKQTCDVIFTLNKDYSNYNQLKELILNELNKKISASF